MLFVDQLETRAFTARESVHTVVVVSSHACVAGHRSTVRVQRAVPLHQRRGNGHFFGGGSPLENALEVGRRPTTARNASCYHTESIFLYKRGFDV